MTVLLAAGAWACVARPALAAPESPGGSGAAESSVTSRKAAEERYRTGVAAYTAGKYADAIALFRQADRLRPSAALSFNVARAYEKLGDVPATLAWYRDYLRRAPGSTDAAAIRESVDRLEAELSRRGVQQVTVRSEPSGATLLVDGQPVGVTPWTGELQPGTHAVSLRMRGYVDIERPIELTAADALDVAADLAREQAAPASGPPGSEPPRGPSDDAPPLPAAAPAHAARTWGFVALGAGGAALGGSLVFEILRRGSVEDAKHEPEQLKAAHDLDAARDRQLAARVLAGVGIGLAAAGGVLLVLPAGRESGAPGPRVAIGCGPTGCRAVAYGRFE